MGMIRVEAAEVHRRKLKSKVKSGRWELDGHFLKLPRWECYEEKFTTENAETRRVGIRKRAQE